jgi:uncharacterized protein YjeT (DUF2065 family)
MQDFLVGIGLVFIIEGLVFAAFPGPAKQAIAAVLSSPEGALRIVGVLSAVLGLMLVWFVRG